MSAGIGLGLLCLMYLFYVTIVKWAALKVEASGEKTMTVAGIVAVTMGNVVCSDDECVAVEYYYEWDGAVYMWVSAFANADYAVNTKVPVTYCLGMGIGSCFVVGFLKKYMLILGVIAFILFVSGYIMNLKRKEIRKWQEEKL